tara:strand:- start:814 stop:2238 length:1425 start_codon:yes stop_codon:yes gene_type:complete
MLQPEVQYEEIPESYGAALRKYKHQASETSLKANSTAHIKIYSERNSFANFADSYLTFSVQSVLTGAKLPLIYDNADYATSTANDGHLRLTPIGAAQFIQQLTILNNNRVVEEITDYSKIVALLMYADSSVNSLNQMSVTSGSTYVNEQEWKVTGRKVTDYGGVTNPSSLAAGTGITTPIMTFSIPLSASALLSSKNPFPLGELSGHIELRVQFVTDNEVDQCYYTNVDSASVNIATMKNQYSNVSYNTTVYELEDAAAMEVARDNDFKKLPIKYSVEAYRPSRVQFTVAEMNATARYTRLIPEQRYVSLRYLLCGGFYSNGASAYGTNANQPINPWDTVAFRIGGVQYPNDPYDSAAACAVGALSIYSNISPSIPTSLLRGSYSGTNQRVAAASAAANENQRSVVGLSLQSMPNAEAINGLDTRDVDISLLVSNLAKGGLTDVTATRALKWLTVGCYDAIVVISTDGVLSMSY